MDLERSARVLFAEDSRVQALVLDRTLRQAGYDVTATGDGVEALAAVRAQAPDIIISDIEMPEMDGIDFCRAVKDDPALCGIPVIMVTSLATPSDLIRAIAAGADTYITKPYDADALLARIRERLDAERVHTPLSERPEENVVFAGTPYAVRTSQQHTINFLLALYSNVAAQNEELARLNDRKNQLLGLAAVGVRGPVDDIVAAAALLQKGAAGDLGSAARQLIARIRLSGESIQETLATELDARAIDESELQLDTRPGDLADLVEHVISLHRMHGESEGIDVEFPRPPAQMNALVDGPKMEAAVNALVSFGLSRTERGGTVAVALENANQQLTLSVRDTGTQVETTALGVLFAGPTEDAVIDERTLTGLAIARKVVNGHGGQVWAELGDEGGVTVGFDLPAASPMGSF